MKQKLVWWGNDIKRRKTEERKQTERKKKKNMTLTMRLMTFLFFFMQTLRKGGGQQDGQKEKEEIHSLQEQLAALKEITVGRAVITQTVITSLLIIAANLYLWLNTELVKFLTPKVVGNSVFHMYRTTLVFYISLWWRLPLLSTTVCVRLLKLCRHFFLW